MEEKMWPALKSCNGKRYKPSDELNNHLSDLLPDEVMLSILSSFSMKEVARTSLLSSSWKNVWKKFQILNFEDWRSMEKIRHDHEEDDKERYYFMTWVNHVVEQHIASDIDEFRVTFDLHYKFTYFVDKWVVFALAKQVKKLVLDFTPAFRFRQFETYYHLSPENWMPPLNLAGIKHVLTSLWLKHVNITTEAVEILLHSFSHLENLGIERSLVLTRIGASDLSLSLKHLVVSNCPRMSAIDVCAPMLMSFRYKGSPIELNIKNASSLFDVSIGGSKFGRIAYAFDSLSKYFSQLEYLKLDMWLLYKLNNGIDQCPDLLNLKCLELSVIASSGHSLLGWVPLIEASPVLQKLTVKMYVFGNANPYPGRLAKRDGGRPLQCLKTLELVGFVGCQLDLELATHVFEKAVMLEKVIVDIIPFAGKKPSDGAQERAIELQEKVPRGVKLVIK